MVTLKLVGAERFLSVPLGIKNPLTKGNTIEVSEDSANYLLTLVTYDVANNAHPLFTKDVAAEVMEETTVLTPLDEAVRKGSGRKRSR